MEEDTVAGPDPTMIKCHCGFSVTGTPDYCEEMYDTHRHRGRRSIFGFDSIVDVALGLFVAGFILSVAYHLFVH